MRKFITEDSDKRFSRYFAVFGPEGELQYNFYLESMYTMYIIKIDLERREYLYPLDAGYAKSALPTLNELVKDKRIRECCPYREYEIYPKLFRTRTAAMRMTPTADLLKKLHVDKIIKEFKDNGFNVSREAVVHNFKAWLCDYKSGYRGRGYHLFTPCGCNPLGFRASELYPACRDWQKTYEC